MFLTAANILFFGFWPGTLISFAGESLGALLAFVLYRKGFKKKVEKGVQKYPSVNRLLQTEGREAFYAIMSLRLIPFIPSGLITFTAAMGKVKPMTFFLASSLGKIPALLIESYAAYQVTAFNWQGKLILFLVAVYLLYHLFKKRKS